MLTIRRSQDRGHANHGWLDSHHTFSFAGYHDPAFMGFGHLRVINQDRVEASGGFGTHPHRDMEILSYVIEGELAHKDTIGTGSVIRPGEVQLMSAGSGIAHSELNPSAEHPVRFLQIWIVPAERGGPAAYQQRDFGNQAGKVLVVSPEGRDGSLRLRQDADVWRLRLEAGDTVSHSVQRRRVWIQVVQGGLTVNGEALTAGDGVAIDGVPDLSLTSTDGAEALLFDLL